MSEGCCDIPTTVSSTPGWRRALWIALTVNAGMFAGELYAGFASGSVALRADALDFLGDSASYVISLAVVSLALRWRARAALLKGIILLGFGAWLLVSAGLAAARGIAPEAGTMGAVAFFALIANLGVAALLYRFRTGDANMQSVWVCSRNDAVGNVAVMLAALGVFGTGTLWPDLCVASVMAAIAFLGGMQIIRAAIRELREVNALPAS